MGKKLNISKIEDSMLKLGLSKSDLAEKLGVSRTSVTSWLKPEKFPRPRHLLQLSNILGLDFDDLVTRLVVDEPQVAFRKSGNHKIKEEHVERLEYSAKLLKKLVPYLPFDELSTTPKLKRPENSYEYYQKAAHSVRKSFGLDATKIDSEHLFKIFGVYKAVLIPVLWGVGHYKNATHIFLPDSETTWVFVNLDVKPFDFKFWLSHELGHSKAPQLVDSEGEDFADGFAGALLFPEHEVKSLYPQIMAKHSFRDRFEVIKNCAIDLMISPITIYKQTELFIKQEDKEPLGIEKGFYPANTNFLKNHDILSSSLFMDTTPSAAQLIDYAESRMESCFFDVLRSHLEISETPTKFIANLMDISIEDAVALNKELSIATAQDPR